MDNLQNLVKNLTTLRSKFTAIVAECTLVAENISISPNFPKRRLKTKVFSDKTTERQKDNSEENFKINVFYVLIDSVIANLTRRYKTVRSMNELFNFLWKYPTFTEDELKERVKTWSEIYKTDVHQEELQTEMLHMKTIQPANFPDNLSPLQLVNTIEHQKLSNLFPNVVVALRVFCTLPVTVAEAERSFSLLARVKNFLRSTMCQERLSSLGMLALENELAKKLSFDDVIDSFASKKSRKVKFWNVSMYVNS